MTKEEIMENIGFVQKQTNPIVKGNLQSNLLLEHKDFVEDLIKKLIGNNAQFADYFQVGLISFVEAIDKFKGNTYEEFLEHATSYITDKIKTAVGEYEGDIFTSNQLANILNEIMDTEVDLEERLERTPTEEEVSASMNISVEALRDYKEYACKCCGITPKDKSDSLAHIISNKG